MRLIDREHRHFGALEKVERLGLQQALRRDIDEPQIPAREIVQHGAIFRRIIGRIERRGRNAVAAQLRHLIAHQRDQGRDHDGQAIPNQSWKLVAQRLAAAGRHHGEHVAAGENRFDDFGLTGPKCRKTEGFAKNVLRRREVGHRHVRHFCRL